MTAPPSRRSPRLALALGMVMLATGFAAARWRLPEWRGAAPAQPALYLQTYHRALQQAGLAAGPGTPRVRLTTAELPPEDSSIDLMNPAYRELEQEGASWLAAPGRGLLVEVLGEASRAGAGQGRLRLVLARDGTPVVATWAPSNPLTARGGSESVEELDREGFASLCLTPGERMGPERDAEALTLFFSLHPLEGTDPPELVVVTSALGSSFVMAHRKLGDVERQQRELEALSITAVVLKEPAKTVADTLLLLGVGILFVGLLLRRRIDFVNASLLAGASLLLSLAAAPGATFSAYGLVSDLLRAVQGALAVFVLWSAAESWSRRSAPRSGNNLDELRAGLWGPRLGDSLITGWGLGAALAGATLLSHAVAVSLPGLAPLTASVMLPAVTPGHNPLGAGLLWAGTVLLAATLARRLAPPRWQEPVALLLATLLLAPPFGLTLVVLKRLPGGLA